MTISVSRSGPVRRSSSNLVACRASGSFVIVTPVVVAPPRRAALAAPAATTAPTQTATVRHGCRLLTRARDCGDRRTADLLAIWADRRRQGRQ